MPILRGDLRLRPSFMIIGAAKAGTSSVYQNLCRHSYVREAARKELHFFERQYDNGMRWYYTHFPLPPISRVFAAQSGSRKFITGEATPGYLFFPYAPSRIAKVFPDQKLIVLLRGFYYEQLSIWFEHYPREQFLIIKSEDYFADSMHYINKVIPAFLKMPEGDLATYAPSGQEKHSPYKIDPRLRSELMEFFKPHNEQLYNLLGVDLGW